MKTTRIIFPACAGLLLLFVSAAAQAQKPFGDVCKEVNQKMVKLYGSGGFRGLASYGTGVVVSPQGHVLTVASTLLDTPDLRVHLYDGRRMRAKTLVVEPELDAALIQIQGLEDELPYFDIGARGQAPLAQTGDWILAFSNQFQIATRDEPMTVQQGVIASYSKLHGRRGIFEAPYKGEVYVLDAITNNPGGGGGALTTRKGELLGIVGKELRNSLTDTWMNYAVPVQSLAKFVEEAKAGKYVPKERPQIVKGQGGFHGIILVPNVVERTPPFIEDILPGSPAEKAGLLPDDLVVYIDGEQIPSVASFNEMMELLRPGTQIKMEVRRLDRQTKADRLITVEMTLMDPPVARKARKQE
ncbi:MAG: S1C family serine protease [Gemmataceae bacterium]